MIKLGAKELRKKEPTRQELEKIKRRPIFIVLDNVLDTYNVGAIFRLADAVGACLVCLCGETATPSDPKVGHKIVKASVGTWRWVKWQYFETTEKAVKKIRAMGRGSELDKFFPRAQNLLNSESKVVKNFPRGKKFTKINIVAIEQHPKSVSYEKAEYKLPLALIVGNETEGIGEKVLKLADQIVEIPMFGVNKSLNVMVSLAIVLYEVVKQVK